MITVGTTQRHYPAIRNFLSNPSPEVRYVRTGNAFRYPEHAIFKTLGITEPLIGNLNWGARGCDVLHFFNKLSLGSTPWVTTFETVVPRWNQTRGWAVPFGVKLLAGKPCRRLIAFSECTRDFQLAFLADHPAHADAIAAKITVLHPPQPVLTDAAPAAPEGEIHFAIVGADFFRKGGLEVLRVFDRLLGEGAAVRLSIVSTLAGGDYATHSTAEDLAEARRLIAKWPAEIDHVERLPNDQVLALFERAHVALLPSWADTYGYSVLEAQAAGCPVLTTDIRALPEINSDATGWVIPVPKDARGNGVLETAADRARFSALLAAGIEAALRAMIANPASIAVKGAAALAQIRARHDPVAHGERLVEIYREALAV